MNNLFINKINKYIGATALFKALLLVAPSAVDNKILKLMKHNILP